MRIIFQSNPVIAPTTSAGAGTFSLGQGQFPARLVATGLAEGESVSLLTLDGDDSIETPVFKDGTEVTLTATNPGFGVNGPGPYKVSKGSTAGAVGVFLAIGK